MKKTKALVLFSGGLDSILAVKILEKQGIEVIALTFKSYFFNEELAKKAVKESKIPLKIVDFSKEHLEIVKNPKYGYGKNMNPCIDCHILMLKYAKKIIHPIKSCEVGTQPFFIKRAGLFNRVKAGKFDFVATGEVLGERPMSQNKKALEIIEKESSLKGYLLRPLSAKLLKPTIPEKLGIVDRSKLLDISGRSRKRQLELAKKFKLKSYPTPSGGCLLTDPEFSKRVKELSEIYSKFQKNDIELLKLGRHFGKDKIKIIVGRNKEEDKKIEKLVRKNDVLIEMKNYPGPLTLVRNYLSAGKQIRNKKISKKILETAKNLTQYYSTKARNKKNVSFKVTGNTS